MAYNHEEIEIFTLIRNVSDPQKIAIMIVYLEPRQ